MVEPIKIVVSGPVGAGKTTFIQCLSETPVVSTDEVATEEIGKQNTTVAMDFGTLNIDVHPIYLFGTPGQERFDYMWQVLCEGALGLLLLVAGDQPQTFLKARHILEYITSQIPIPFIVGVTRQDQPKVWAPRDIASFLGVPQSWVVGLDAREPESALDALYQIFARINEAQGVSQGTSS